MKGEGPRRLALLLGDPVAHSLSPLIHNAAFSALGLDVSYRAARVPPAALAAAIVGLRDPQVLGANITIPHKKAAAELMDSLSVDAAATRAINTVANVDGRLVGYNTDVAGFIEPLRSRNLTPNRVLVLGSGGAARAVVYALISRWDVSSVLLAARREDQAREVLADMRTHNASQVVEWIPFSTAGSAAPDVDLIINTTPVGMNASAGESPLAGARFASGTWVYDLVYSPRLTRLLQDAADAGASTISGIEMLIAQAAEAFRVWTNREMPIPVVLDALQA